MAILRFFIFTIIFAFSFSSLYTQSPFQLDLKKELIILGSSLTTVGAGQGC